MQTKSGNSSLPARAITMRDVAQAAGVAQSTVSRALRNDPRLSEPQRERVKAMAKSLGYRPNPYVAAFTAQILHHRRSPRGAVIAIIECNAKDAPDYSQEYREGAAERAHSLGFATEVFYLHELEHSITRLNQVLWTRSIVAMLVMPVQKGIDLSRYSFANTAAATVDPTLHTPILHRAEAYYFHGMQLALQTLENRGYKRATFCTLREQVESIGEEWLGGFTGWQALKPKKERMEVCLDVWGKTDFARWIERHRPDAIIANIPEYFGWARELGHKPPDFAYITLNGGIKYPEFSGIDQNSKLVAAAAVDSIVAQINRNEFGLPLQPKTVMVQGSWFEGTTIRPER
jgi:LacI family transcriptional regulator